MTGVPNRSSLPDGSVGAGSDGDVDPDSVVFDASGAVIVCVLDGLSLLDGSADSA